MPISNYFPISHCFRPTTLKQGVTYHGNSDKFYQYEWKSGGDGGSPGSKREFGASQLHLYPIILPVSIVLHPQL